MASPEKFNKIDGKPFQGGEKRRIPFLVMNVKKKQRGTTGGLIGGVLRRRKGGGEISAFCGGSIEPDTNRKKENRFCLSPQNVLMGAEKKTRLCKSSENLG